MAYNYASLLKRLNRLEEAQSLLRKTLPVARRVLSGSSKLTLSMKQMYGETLYLDDGATLDDLREAVTILEDTERTARRVLGAAHPTTAGMETALLQAQAALRARETPSGPGA